MNVIAMHASFHVVSCGIDFTGSLYMDSLSLIFGDHKSVHMVLNLKSGYRDGAFAL